MQHSEVPHSESVRELCPALSDVTAWDSGPALRGELYASEHLASHAAELAAAHGAPLRRHTAGPLRKRFGLARAQLRNAYDVLSRAAHNKRDPSPAEEWLLDNSHVVDEQIREIQEDLPWGYLVELPRLRRGAMAGYPRVYGLCLDYLRHTDAHVDLKGLAEYVSAYQRVSSLTIGELWAVPIMLRLGLILTVSALAVSEARAQDRERADKWADRFIGEADTPGRLEAALVSLEKSDTPITAGLLVQLLKRVREHDAPLVPVVDWIAARCAAMGTTPDDLTRREHLRQAADHVSVGNAITSMRAIAALDWTEFFELTSDVEQVLRLDPCGAYPRMDQPSRDRCRHAVEQLARRSGLGERAVADRVLALASEAARSEPDSARAHVGYFLIDRGRRQLQDAIGYRASWSERLRRPLLAAPTWCYLGMFSLILLVLLGGATAVLAPHVHAPWLLGLLLALCVVPASELAQALVTTFLLVVLPPRLLPKLDFEAGIPVEARTLVAVPCLLESRAGIAELLEELEIRALANPDQNLYFALVTDFADSSTPETEQDQPLLDFALEGIEQLNRTAPVQRYFLLHRRRVLSSVQGRYMGWERKRGKLMELNRLLRGSKDTTFSVVTAPEPLLRGVRYVITLDADTQLPREVARRLVGTMAHPLNRAVVDPRSRRVTRGYGIIQPRVGTSPQSSRRSRFARIFAGPPGIDPYTTAVSDLYQDLFGEGSFLGKGIYDVDAFEAALAGRVPEDSLLSHDLFEGGFARSALATDVEVFDDHPASYEVVASREHRWMRGDWQLLPWLFPRVPIADGQRGPNELRALDLWKLFDNLRRSLVPPTLVLLVTLSWFGPVVLARWALVLLVGVFAVPIAVRSVFGLSRAVLQRHGRVAPVGGELLGNLKQAALNLVLLLDRALLSLDAIGRTLYRLLISRRNLLEWTTMSQAAARYQNGAAKRSRRFSGSAWLALLMLVGVLLLAPRSLPYALLIGLAWLMAPAIAAWLGQLEQEPAPDAELNDAGRSQLRLVARKTWRFFETFVTAGDNWLPPDNYQEDPRGIVAHRTSPTNIGLYLLSTFAARDLGFITASQALTRLENTLQTLSRLERRSGHILNWYDTTTLQPLEPQYVSTVDSGNLAAYLWTVREACHELSQNTLCDAQTFAATRDALRLAVQAFERQKQEIPQSLLATDRRLAAAAPELENGTIEAFALLMRSRDEMAELLQADWSRSADAEARYWLERAAEGLDQACAQLATLAPCLPWLASNRPSWPSASAAELYDELVARVALAKTPAELAAAAASFVEELPGLEQLASTPAAPASLLEELRTQLLATQEAVGTFQARAAELGKRAVELADGMDFRFLYDEARALFSIGYNVSGARLDGSHYDLLASEARLASLVAISKGDAPLEHWWKLGRPRTATTAGRALLSWSGSMFEYLMPLLVTGASRDTLLWETCHSAVARQRDYAAGMDVPWGISESAYNVMDLGMNYQYRAFGVPGLGFKSGLAEDLVIAPYASVLAALVRPDLALQNLETLERAGLSGRYGYFEAVDYTASRVPPGRRSVVVKAFMAHHQGMSLVALCNVLCDWPMRRRFFSDARVKASALLLEERLPVSSPLTAVRADQAGMPSTVEPELRLTDHVGLGSPGVERLHLLGQGELSTIVSATGTGVLTWRGLDVTRFRDDSALGAHGIFIYIRDLSAQKLWSVAEQPTGAVPDYYDASFSIDRVELKRRDGAIETVTELVVSPEHPMEVRRVTLTNHGDRAVELDLTTYTEPVLAPRGSDIAHRAFSSMFLSVELLPERGAILVHRRPRGAHDPEAWLLQVLVPDGDEIGPAEADGSRVELVGRGGSLRQPRALRFGHRLSGKSGDVLDPALSLRRRVRLAAAGRARMVLTTALASSREAALELLDLITAPHAAARAFELAWADARVELKHLGITAARSHRFQRLLSCLLRAPRALRDTTEVAEPLRSGKGALFSQGISGDLPILLLCIDSPEFSEICQELLLAQEFWRINGVSCDLVLLNEEPAGYLQPIQEAIEDAIRASPARGRENQRGGVFLRRASQISNEDRRLLLRSARVVLRAAAGSLSQQLRRAAEQPALPQLLRAHPVAVEQAAAATPPAPELKFFNGVGGFSADGREYVMHVGPGARPPAPWCNVLANERFGSVVSEQGLGFTWAENSQRTRLTPWSNDAVEDPAGEAVYLRDDASGVLWSATPAPASPRAEFKVRHGQGYTIYAHTQAGLEQELTVLVSANDPVKLLRLRVKNRGNKKRSLSVYAVAEWVLGPARDATRLHVGTSWDGERALFANNPLELHPEAHAFIASSEPVVSHSGDREEFFGRGGSRARPAALLRQRLSGNSGIGYDPCGALQVALELGAGETREICFVLGHGRSLDEARSLVARHTAPQASNREFEALGPLWDGACAITAHTPDSAFDLMLNRWLPYQVLGARFWARSGFYQSGGAYGFRDQLQDVLALVHARPELTRAHLLRAAARQFTEGDVQHWWHADTGEGVRTRCSDDLLFLPYAVAAYVQATGDTQVLDEVVPFLEERELSAEDEDLFSSPAKSSHAAPLYEHCLRAIRRGTTRGPHGLPLMGNGDWNDGMNRVGREGQGESIWLGFFLVRTLQDFMPLAQARGDQESVRAYQAESQRLLEALHATWDGAWYPRAFFDDGTAIGSHNNSECRIDAIAQSWSVIAGSNPERARQALESSIQELVVEDARLMRLLTPPFQRSEPDPGYIRSYPQGIRENGGQYTHGVLWTVQALCNLGEGERAHWLLSLLNPISHARNPAELRRYCVEPYVVAADVYASPQHWGRGGWTWYTGAAAWMYRIGVESVLGLRRRGQALEVAPCVPPSWREYSVTYRYGGSELTLNFQNDAGVAGGVQRIELDGRTLPDAIVPLVDDGRRHQALVILGRAEAIYHLHRARDAVQL